MPRSSGSNAAHSTFPKATTARLLSMPRSFFVCSTAWRSPRVVRAEEKQKYFPIALARSADL